MAKQKYIYVCQECGATSVKWYGRCPACGEWNSLVQEAQSGVTGLAQPESAGAEPQPVGSAGLGQVARILSGISELDSVLGGGLVPGSLVLLGGEPGIGKSTLLLQAAKALADQAGTVLYVSGEESAPQVGLRAERLQTISPDLLILPETSLEHILAKARERKLAMLVVDSIQSVYLPELTAAPGSVSQVRQCCLQLLEYAKESGVIVFLVGHVTKEGMLAGPRVLEHMVDTVLYFEGERYNTFRLLRAVKNRFGSTNEIGVFAMEERGLMPVMEPSSLFLAERVAGSAGSAISCAMQGSRPVLLEVQGLTTPTTFGNPRRLALGFDYNRLLIIIAVLEKKLGLNLGSQDIYINIAGGLRVDDPAVDMAVAAAIVSSYRNQALDAEVLLLGEIGLTGELRRVAQTERRVKEAAKFGLNTCILPKGCSGSAAKSLIQAESLEQVLVALGLR